MMRIGSFTLAASLVVLSGCGGPQTSQANNAQANISNDSRDATNAAGSNMEERLSLGDAAKIMHDRHEAMEGLGKAMKDLHRELDSGKPDINVIRVQTATMASTAAKIPAFFPAGTGPDVGKTRAKPEVWTQKDLFSHKAKDFLAASLAIDAAARTGDVNKVMALHDNVDKACKACHDPFRAPEH
jgi:cytochrome c556